MVQVLKFMGAYDQAYGDGGHLCRESGLCNGWKQSRALIKGSKPVHKNIVSTIGLKQRTIGTACAKPVALLPITGPNSVY